AHSLEVREPLMDHELVDWMATLPTRLKVQGNEGKWLLKKALEPQLPHDVLYRPKMGFAVPLARWFRGPLKDRVREALTGPVLSDSGLFDPGVLKRLCDEHQSGLHDHSSPMWTLLMFDGFLKVTARR
ncbi:MAG: asparagine synthase C-terminal domain-containing protein, partial [Ferrovibrio sp.]|uniref:asparagine synthase-related protein n=1 Tax=Ferrovibrio sp. TaxID=1917215 RepID=UPI002607E083